MIPAPVPADEDLRLKALMGLEALDTQAEAEFDALVKAAALICGMPISLVSLIDHNRQWFKANIGLPGISETPRDVAFCAHAILGDDIFEIPDAMVDPRFSRNPLVLGNPDIRFYAGAPLRLSSGQNVGTLCVIDRQPRKLSDVQREALSCLASATVKALEGRLSTQKLHAALRAMDQREANLRLIVDNSPALMAYWDSDLNCVFANNSFDLWFDIKDVDIIGKNINDAPLKDIFNKNEIHIERVMTGQRQSFERIISFADGVRRHIFVCYVPDIVDGKTVGFLSQVSDVTALKSTEQALHEAQRLGHIGSWQWCNQSDTTFWSPELFRIMGRDAGSAPPTFLDHGLLYTPDSWARLHDAVTKALDDGLPYLLELEFLKPGGGTGWLEARGEAKFDTNSTIVGLSGTVQDITTRRALIAELAEQHELLQVTLNSIGDAVITTNADGTVRWLNPVATAITGWALADAIGMPFDEVMKLVDEETRQHVSYPIDEIFANNPPISRAKPTVLIARDGREFCIEQSATSIRGVSDAILGAVFIFRDVTRQRLQSKEVAFRAQHDSLTKLLNRSEFEARLLSALKNAQSNGQFYTLMFIDLDRFKLVNDSCGHAAGDLLLQNVSDILKRDARSTDIVARLGGDEFAILLENCTHENGSRIAQRICDRLNDYRFIHEQKRFRISASIGLVHFDRSWQTSTAIMQAADRSCYAAKAAGRNRVHTWFEADENIRARQSQMQWAARLENALDDGSFQLFAQRIVPTKGPDHRHHLEVLLRLVASDGTIIGPGEFFPAAERFNLTARIDRHVLTEVVNLLKKLNSLLAFETICVNISGQSIDDLDFHKQALSILSAAGSAICSCICLEITETAAITSMVHARDFIDQVRNLGVKVAIDDFGAGAATFGYLKSLPIDVLKIDGQFVINVVNDPLDEAAIRCFVEVARIMGVKVIAECVETEATFGLLKKLGVDYAQGYLFHRPQPLDEVLNYITKFAA